METINVSIDKEVWGKFKEYCDKVGYRYAIYLTNIIQDHLEWINNPQKKAEQLLNKKDQIKEKLNRK